MIGCADGKAILTSVTLKTMTVLNFAEWFSLIITVTLFSLFNNVRGGGESTFVG